ncbi:hypothetical protein [Sphingobacterium multivorum]|nr:hypothetical protein [Sphingobacterium multivorum]
MNRFLLDFKQGAVFGAALAPETKKALSDFSESAVVCGRGGIRT